MRKFYVLFLVLVLGLVVAGGVLAAPNEGKVTPAATAVPNGSITAFDFFPDSTQNMPAACAGQIGCGERCYVAPSGAMDCEPFIFYLGPNQ